MPVELGGRSRAPRGPHAAGSVPGSILGPVTTTIRSAGTRRFASGNASIDPAQQVPADAGAADGDDADLLVVSIAELMPQRVRGRRSQHGSKPVT